MLATPFACLVGMYSSIISDARIGWTFWGHRPAKVMGIAALIPFPLAIAGDIFARVAANTYGIPVPPDRWQRRAELVTLSKTANRLDVYAFASAASFALFGAIFSARGYRLWGIVNAAIFGVPFGVVFGSLEPVFYPNRNTKEDYFIWSYEFWSTKLRNFNLSVRNLQKKFSSS